MLSELLVRSILGRLAGDGAVPTAMQRHPLEVLDGECDCDGDGFASGQSPPMDYVESGHAPGRGAAR